jgi:hypothetical protein
LTFLVGTGSALALDLFLVVLVGANSSSFLVLAGGSAGLGTDFPFLVLGGMIDRLFKMIRIFITSPN